MRWLKYSFIALISVLIAGVTMLVTLVLLLDQNQLRDGLVYVVNRDTGYQLQINGPLTLDLSRYPTLQVSDVYFKTAADDFELSAAEIRLQVDITSLWSNYLIVPELVVRDSLVNIRSPLKEEAMADEPFEPIEARIPALGELRVENLQINYSQPGETGALTIKVQSLKKDTRSDKGQIAVTGVGSINGTAFKLEGESGTITGLQTSDEPFPFDYRFEVLQAIVHAEGRIIDPRGAAEIDANLKTAAPELQDILDLLQINAPDMGSLEATARLSGPLETPRLDDIQLSLSKDRVAVRLTGRVEDLLAAAGIRLDFSASVTDAALLAWSLPEQSPRFNSVKLSGKLSGSAGALLLSYGTVDASDAKGHKLHLAGSTRIIDAPQPLRDLKVTLSIAAPDTAFSRQFSEAIPLLGPVAGSARVSMATGVLQIDDIKLTTGNRQKLQLAAKGNVKLSIPPARVALAGLDLDIDLQAPSTAALTAIAATEIPALGALKGAAHVSRASGVAAITALDLNVHKGEGFQLALNGSLADLEKLSGLDMKIDLSATDLDTIGQLFEQSLPKEGPVKYSGRARGSLEQTRINGRANLRSTTITTDLTAAVTGKRPRITGSVAIPDLDVHDIGIHPEKRAATASAPASETFEQAASEQAVAAEKLFNKEPIDFSGLSAVDLDLEITIDRLSSTQKSIADMYAHVLLDNGKLTIKPLKYSVDDDVINNDIVIDSSSRPATVSLQVGGDDVDLGLLLAGDAGKASPVRGIMTARVDLNSRGQSPAALAANLDGKIDVVTENARVAKTAMNLVNVDVIGWTISNILSPDQDVDIACGIFMMHFSKGIGTTDLHIIDTPETLIRIDAELDLVNETMDVAIVPEHKVRLFKFKKDPIKIYGPIASPQYELVSIKDLAQEASRTWLLAPLTLSTGLLSSIAGLIVEPDDPKPGSCDKFLQ